LAKLKRNTANMRQISLEPAVISISRRRFRQVNPQIMKREDV